MRLLAILLCAAAAVPPQAGAEEPRWTERERRILQSMMLDPGMPPPASPSNDYADSPEAAALGKKLFFDPRPSADGSISCASCHEPAKYFTDGKARSVGTGEAMRNAPTIVGTAHNRWFYWDGRRDSLWAQALIPFEAADEMGSSRVAVVRLIHGDAAYRDAYEKAFGEPIDDLILRELPGHAGPFGAADARDAWAKLSHTQQTAINRVYANVGKAIAAYERTLNPPLTPFDRYVAALADEQSDGQLTGDEIAGARLFMDAERSQCLQCHSGPFLTNGEFHNIGTGNFSGENLDFGRAIGLRAVLMDEFNCLGPYSDAEQYECVELMYLNKDSHLPLRGAFKVPTLRGLRHTAPYFHDGRFATLREVLEYYNEPPSMDEVGPHELRPMGFDEAELKQLEKFLLSLSH